MHGLRDWHVNFPWMESGKNSEAKKHRSRGTHVLHIAHALLHQVELMLCDRMMISTRHFDEGFLDEARSATSTLGAVTVGQLESHLWESANILRGPVDAAGFKSYVFPLLFFKRLCDVVDEETVAALLESGGDEDFALFPENHRFQVPADAHWRKIRTGYTHRFPSQSL